MKIKIKCSVSELLKQGLPLVEAERLSGNLFEAIKPGCNQYYQVSGIDRDGDARVWLFGDSEVELVSEKAPSLDLTKPVQTRDGRAVKLLSADIDSDLLYPIVGVIEGASMPTFWNRSGTNYAVATPINDLVQAPGPLIEGWVNVYAPPDDAVRYNMNASREEADESASEHRIACIKVSYRKGAGL